MANKREFKKYADAIGADVVNEMLLAYHTVEGADKDKINKAVQIVLGAIGKAKCNANVFFDRGPKGYADRKEYAKDKANFFKNLFNKIETEFGEEVNEGLKLFNEALPESYKAAQKAVAAE